MQPADSSWMVPIKIMLGSLNHAEVQACSISSVPDGLREPKEDAFKPKVVSIGPLHRGTTRHLQLMEETKWRYMREFLNRNRSQGDGITSENRLELCGAEIVKMDKVIIASYGGNIESEPQELAKIMIVDGCFLLEFLFRLGTYMMEVAEDQRRSYLDDSIFQDNKKVLSVMNDITMLENQVPFVVLKKLYRKVYPHTDAMEGDHRVANLVREAFGYPLVERTGGAHILNLIHLSTVEYEQNQTQLVQDLNQSLAEPLPEQNDRKWVKKELVRCATRLRAAGITILAKPTSDRELVDRFNFDISFNDGMLKIPALHIKKTTEVKWRNLIAWEQSKISIRCKCTSYALFFRGLICCKHDIELLEERGVIVNKSNKSKEDLLDLFLTISNGAENMDSSYSEICARLNTHRGRNVTTALQGLPVVTWHKCRHIFQIITYYWGNWYRILIRDHIPTVWKFIAVLAAVVLLVLTIIQTYYTVRSSN